MNDKSANLLSLFASTSTLICCALPAFFVAIGAGATFVSIVSTFPFLIVVSQHKIYVILFALIMIGIAGYINYKTYNMPCPLDSEIAKLCLRTRKRSRIIYYLSVALFSFTIILNYIIPRFI